MKSNVAGAPRPKPRAPRVGSSPRTRRLASWPLRWAFFGWLAGTCVAGCHNSWPDAGDSLPNLEGAFTPGLVEATPMPRRHAVGRRRTSSSEDVQAPVDGNPDNPWFSPDACRSLLNRAKRAARTPGMARLGTWNIRWFPDGVPGRAASPEQGTDLNWLACAIAWLDLDALALQEIKTDTESREKLDQVLAELGRLSGHSWSVVLDSCPARNGQHVAWLTDPTRVKVTSSTQFDAVNPHGSACADQLRPGLGVSLEFPLGLDLQAITVHLKSGVTERDIGLRERSWASLTEILTAVARQSGDPDVLVMGDFNSMGCRNCEHPFGNESELAELDRQLRMGELPARRVGARLPCSHYYQRQPGLLDHVVVAESMRELSSTARSEVEGYCANLKCEPYSGKEPRAFRRLSDHCPLIVELTDRDLD